MGDTSSLLYGSLAGAFGSSSALQQQACAQQAMYKPGQVLPVDSNSTFFLQTANDYATIESTSITTTATTNPYAWYTYSNGINIQPQQVARQIVQEAKKKFASFRDELRSEIDGWLEPSVA